MEMPTTVEELQSFIDERIDNHKAERSSAAVRAFKRDLEQWLGEMPNKERNANRSAVYALIKTRLGLRSIQALSDDQVADAENLLNGYKKLLG